MNVIRSEHNWPHRSLPWLMAAGVLASLFLALTAIRARAADPPQPDFFWPYGKVQLDGANIFPTSQRVIGIVNGKSCGDASTLVAQAGAGVPAGDVGKTVYVVDILAGGTNSGQRPGCGHPGDVVSLYFPQMHRFALQEAAFAPGSLRLDVDLGGELPFRLQGPMLANDGTN
ncbi:MAG: hypothetical protein U0837_06185 [Dehalococcoidia bacterium]